MTSNPMKLPAFAGLGLAALVLAGCQSEESKAPRPVTEPTAVVDHYIAIAQNSYGDSLTTAITLQKKVDNFLEAPTEANLKAAREAWISARIPYQQTEVFRFGNPVVDEWEGKVNSWPLDEGLIDYVSTSRYGEESEENPFYTANLIANPTLRIGGKPVDATTLSPEFLRSTLHEIDEVETNVATGYHAIEFLLWGQDLHGSQPGAGERPATDYSLENCTGGHCDRRQAYLSAAVALLVNDLQYMVNNWAPEGRAYQELKARGPEGGLAVMVAGMGSLAYGELAGERTKLGLMLHDPEEEHDCFSDNTHWSHFHDAQGIQNVYLGRYQTQEGTMLAGPSLSELVAARSPELDQQMREKLQATQLAAQAMVDAAAQGNTFDVLIGSGNPEGNQLVQTFIDALIDQTRTLEKIVVALNLDGIQLEGSDSLDNPGAVL